MSKSTENDICELTGEHDCRRCEPHLIGPGHHYSHCDICPKWTREATDEANEAEGRWKAKQNGEATRS